MNTKTKAQAGINLFGCRIQQGTSRDKYTGKPRKRMCEGLGSIPITLEQLADIRTNGEQRFADVEFSCGHKHTLVLT